jgi:hypothetical protein
VNKGDLLTLAAGIALVAVIALVAGPHQPADHQSGIVPPKTPSGTPVPTPLLTTPVSTLTLLPDEYPEGSLDIPVRGDPANCSLQTGRALSLLKSRDPGDYRDIIRYIRLIECRDNWSGMYAWEDPPRFAVGIKTRAAGTMWYAGAIAHDSCHSRQYSRYLQIHSSGPVPPDVFSGKSAELECLQYQASVLRKMGATPAVIQYVNDSADREYWNVSTVWW